jgi:hypothetical protein
MTVVYIHIIHPTLLSSESEFGKRSNDRQRDEIRDIIRQRKKQAIIDARIRGEVFEGDWVRESDSFMTGIIINTNDKYGNVTMQGDDGKIYKHNQSHFSLIEKENKVEIEKEKHSRIEEARRLEEANKQHRRKHNFEVFVGDRVIESDSKMTGRIIKMEGDEKYSLPHAVMMGDNGQEYVKHVSHFTIYNPEVEQIKEKHRRIEEARRLEVEQIKKEMDIIKTNHTKLEMRLQTYKELFELNNSLIQLIEENLSDVTGEVINKCVQIRDETLRKNQNIKIEQQKIKSEVTKYISIDETLRERLRRLS